MAIAALCAIELFGSACSGRPAPVSFVSDPLAPAPPELSAPQSAVRSYLAWTSLAYRLADSGVSTATHTPREGVRVDSYIELNRQKGQGIEQTLTAFGSRVIESREQTALVATDEEWAYRYFSLATLEYLSEPLAASYEATYTVVRQPDGRWLVDSIDARPLGEVP